MDPDEFDRWSIRVQPSGNGAVTVTLPAGGDCATGPCTDDGRALSQEVTATSQGPPALSIADAEVDEGPDAKLAFAITLDRAASGTVTVQASTSDGTAVAGEDYRAKTLTKTFAPGETRKVAVIRVLDDSHSEGTETMTLTLSNPVGAYIADGEAVGTIKNADPIPQAWLARFGRTVADQVLTAVESRTTTLRTPGMEVSIAGRQVGGEPLEDTSALEAEARLETMVDWLGDDYGDQGPQHSHQGTRHLGQQEMRGRDFLLGSSFDLTAGSAETGFGALWGQGAISNFDGRDGELSLDGEVLSAMMGVDWLLGRGSAGVAVAHSSGKGDYVSPAGSGEMKSTLTGVYPYGRYDMSERLSVWGVAGYGAGTMTLTPEGVASIETDMDLTMAAVGGRSLLVQPAEEAGLEIAARSDALVVRTTSEEVRGSDGNLAATTADVTRLRLGLHGTWQGIQLGGGTVVPGFEFGVRHDGGDAETGFGADIGGGLTWIDLERGITAEFRARRLLTHEDGSFSESGFAGSLLWDPDPVSDRGPSLRVSQMLGASATGGMDALLGTENAHMLSGSKDGSGDLQQGRFEANFGYGFAVFNGMYTGTPELGLELSDVARDVSLGWRLAEGRRDGIAFGLDLEGRRRHSVTGTGGPEHRLLVGLGWRLVGARRDGLNFAFRLEASRLMAANDYQVSDNWIGIRMATRW